MNSTNLRVFSSFPGIKRALMISSSVEDGAIFLTEDCTVITFIHLDIERNKQSVFEFESSSLKKVPVREQWIREKSVLWGSLLIYRRPDTEKALAFHVMGNKITKQTLIVFYVFDMEKKTLAYDSEKFMNPFDHEIQRINAAALVDNDNEKIYACCAHFYDKTTNATTTSFFTFKLTHDFERISFTASAKFTLNGESHSYPYLKRNNHVKLFVIKTGKSPEGFSLSLADGEMKPVAFSGHDGVLPTFREYHYRTLTTFTEGSLEAITFLLPQHENCKAELWLFYREKRRWKLLRTFNQQHSIAMDNRRFSLCVNSNGTAFVHSDCSNSECSDGAHIYPLDLSIAKHEIIGSKLGEGTFGKVSPCNITFGVRKKVTAAVKISKKLSMFAEIYHSRIVQCTIMEAVKLKNLNHENIIRGFGFIIEESRILSFMELMKESVRQKIDRTPGKRLSEDESLRIFEQCLKGLTYLHTRKPHPIVHRDIKGANILVNENGVAKLCDMGLMKTLILSSTGSTNYSQVSLAKEGTIFFKAPEALRGENVGRKSDVWSLGCALVEMLTGSPPYASSMDGFTWFHKLEKKKLSYKPHDLISNASQDIAQILLKTFCWRTRQNINMAVRLRQLLTTDEPIRPYSWELLDDVCNMRLCRFSHWN